VEYISHLDALAPDASASVLASWSSYARQEQEQASLIEQLQTTLDIEQLLSIFLNMVGSGYKVHSLELDTYHGQFTAGKSRPSSHVMTLPIRINDRLMGRISYFSNKPISDVLMSSLTSQQKALVYPLRNALAFWQLQQVALKDPLTGVGNRAMYDDAVVRKTHHAKRFCEPFVLMVLDLDNFKQVNDIHGHLMGDEVLVAFVNLVSKCLRGNDQLFRFGGDEFAIILENETLDAAKIVAARIHHAINESALFRSHNVGTSIGCACYRATDTAADLFARADKALYAAKNAGKNCMKIA
jgi:diguanylate cyclase (GGDEF)-like protein